MPGCNSWSTQSRCCAKESGISPQYGSLVSGGSAAGAADPEIRSISDPSSPSVGYSKSARRGKSTLNASRIRDKARIASKECPPN